MRRILILLLNVVLNINATPWDFPNADNSRDANQTLHRLINSAPVDSLILRTPHYDKSTKYAMVLLVISDQKEAKDREEIRKSWSAESELQKTGRTLLIFLVARSDKLDEEASKYNDLLQTDTDEIYRNLVYKVEIGFRWVYTHVQSRFVVKVDSDTVVHIDRLHEQLRRVENRRTFDQWLVCRMIHGAPPVRAKNPWYVSTTDYPDDVYPRYCQGSGYAMNRAFFDKIVKRMSLHHVLEVEDVFFTGIIARDLGILSHVQGIVAAPFTDRFNYDDDAPRLSMLNTHDQLETGWKEQYKKNLTAAWIELKYHRNMKP